MMRLFALGVSMFRRHARPRKAHLKFVWAERLLTLCALVALCTVSALAQRGAASARSSATAHSAAPHASSRAGNYVSGHSPRSSAFRGSSPYNSSRNSPYNSLPFALFGDFDSDDIYSSGYPVASDPPPYLMEAMREITNRGPFGPSNLNNQEPSASQPLMIELQNGHYVRVNSVAANGDASPIEPSAPLVAAPFHAASSNAEPPQTDLPPAVLVFRDGHTEEVRDYAIADGSLYARGDLYTDGYWNKKIDLASLNLAETRQANASRNVKFVLPSSSNEVITRP